MKFRLILPVLLIALLGLSPSGFARDGERDARSDDRREMRQQMREHWQQERRLRDDSDRRGRSMAPEERQRLRDELRDQRRRPDDGGGRRGRGGD
jgi:hypothetical protein